MGHRIQRIIPHQCPAGGSAGVPIHPQRAGRYPVDDIIFRPWPGAQIQTVAAIGVRPKIHGIRPRGPRIRGDDIPGQRIQRVGLVTMTKVVNRMALACGAGVLILCGLFPKLAALISIMPQSVLGGAAVMMFSSIVVSGIQLITKEKLTGRNITIVSVALGLGYGLGANSDILRMLPDTMQLIFGGSGIVPAAIVALVLNIVLPKDEA